MEKEQGIFRNIKGIDCTCPDCDSVDSFNVEEESWETTDLFSQISELRHYRDHEDNLVHCNCNDEIFWQKIFNFISHLREKDKEGIIKMCEEMKRHIAKRDDPLHYSDTYNQALEDIIERLSK